MSNNRKKMLGGIQRFSTEDGPGIRTTLFFKGCPLKCKWCHNPELLSGIYEILHSPKRCIMCGECIRNCPANAISATEDGIIIDREKCLHCGKCAEKCCSEALRVAGEHWDMKELIEILKKDRDFYKNTGGGITLSGGEVLAQADYAYEIACECKKNGLEIAIETSGFGEYEDLRKLCEVSQTILFDIKCIDAARHKELTGADMKVIHDNLRGLVANEKIKDKIVIRMPLIHGLNDQMDDLERTCRFMVELGLKKVDILPYHQMGMSKTRELGGVPIEYETPSDEYLKEVQALFERYGLDIQILGQEEELVESLF